MKPVQRAEILDYVTYGEKREEIRAAALRAKSNRRILVGEYFTFLFENHETVRYQVQEMMRVEKIVKEDDIQHELDTYNELLHPKGTIGCTLLIGIDDEAARDEKLKQWMGLNDHIYARMPDGTRGIRARSATPGCLRSSTCRLPSATTPRSQLASRCRGSNWKPSCRTGSATRFKAT